MPDTPSSSQSFSPRRSRRAGRSADDPDGGSRAGLAHVIPRRPAVSWWLGLVLALGFAAVVTPAITAEHWLLRFGPGTIAERHEAPYTVRAPMTGTGELRVGGGVVVARGEIATRDEAVFADAITAAAPGGAGLYLAFFALTAVLGALFTHHIGRSTKGRLVRVQVVSLATIALLAIAVKIVLLSTALSALVVPVAVLAMVPTMVLDRVVGLATGVLAALVVSLQVPFDIGLALLLLVQTATAGLIVAERPRRRWLAALTAGAVATVCTAATYLLLTYLISGRVPELRDPLHSPWIAAAIGPALAAVIAVPAIPVYQLLVGEITQGKLIALEDLGHPLLRQIAEKSPGTWQHSLMMANMAEIAANAIGANGRLVRVGAYFHDLGKSLQPKYFIENLEAGETSPHDLLPPEVSCDAIFAHVTEGIVTARKAGLHERIVDFMHMHHGNGVLEYFWAKCREQGNPSGLTLEDFRYPGHPPQSRETALLAICDAVEAASRTLHKPEPAAIDSLVQRIVYGKLHLGQLDDSGLSMGDLRRISDSLRETIRHANHGRIEYPWQKAGQDASASAMATSTTAPRLDSLDRKPARDTARRRVPVPGESDTALAATADVKDSGPTRADAGDATRIRAGTARNAQTSDRRPAVDQVPIETIQAPGQPPVDPAFEPTLEDPGAAHTQLPRADATASQPHGRVLPLAAPPDDADDGVDSDDGVDGVARIIDRPPPQIPPTTLPGRAPNPAAGPDGSVASMAGAAHPRTVARAPSQAEPAETAEGAASPAPPSPGVGPASAASPRLVVRAPSHAEPAIAAPTPASPDGGPVMPASAASPRLVARAPSQAEPAIAAPTPASPDRSPTGAGTAASPRLVARALSQAEPAIAGHAPDPASAPVAGTAASAVSERSPSAGRPPPGRDPMTTLQGRAPGPMPAPPEGVASAMPAPSESSAASAVSERSPSAGRPPLGRDPMTTLQGRAPGPTPAATTGHVQEAEAPWPGPDASPFSEPTRRVVLPLPVRDPMTTLQGRAPGPTSAATAAPEAEPAAWPSSNASPFSEETTRRGGPTAPADPHAAITRPPPLRAGATGQPAGPMDPAQVAAALESLVRRVAHAPFGKAADGAPGAHLDAAITQPSAPRLHPGDLDAAVTQPGLVAAPAHAERAERDAEAVVTRPVLPGAPVGAAHPPPARVRARTSTALRTSGLAAGSVPLPTQHAGEDAIALRRPPGDPATAAAVDALQDDARVALPRAATAPPAAARALAAIRDPDAGVTEPSIPVLAVGDECRVDVPRAPAPAPSPAPPAEAGRPPGDQSGGQGDGQAGWAAGLAARVDAALDSDSWSKETPVAGPTSAELRILLGQADPTREQPVEDIERLQRRAAELGAGDHRRRSPNPTAEVDPDDIEAAIEVAPPARRQVHPNATGAVKPRKPE